MPQYETWLGTQVTYGLDFLAYDSWNVFQNAGVSTIHCNCAPFSPLSSFPYPYCVRCVKHEP